MAELNRFRKKQQTVVASKAAKTRQYLAFMLGGEVFAIDIRFIHEVIQFDALTEVPLMPDFIRGVIHLRGCMVPVIDLAIRFGKPSTEVSKRSCIVILELKEKDIPLVPGIMVDHVSEVIELAESDIGPAPSFNSDPRAEFIQGVGRIGDRFVILLDVQHILSLEETQTLVKD
jgi:purine-binding chemotaxis protein CheW